jgi:hypothetical protein
MSSADGISGGALAEGRWERFLDGEAAAVAYPATPELRPTVLSAVAALPATVGAGRWAWPGGAPRRVALAAAAVLVVVAATLAVPSSRTAVGEFLGLVEGERIEVVPSTPTAATETSEAGAGAAETSEVGASGVGSPSVTPWPTPTRHPLATFGDPVSFGEVERALRFVPALVDGELPVSVYLLDYESTLVVVLSYPAFDLWQARDTGFGYFSKGPILSDWISTPAIGEGFGYWIEGGSYLVRFVDEEGEVVAGSERTVDRNTLIWQGVESGRYYRLESGLSLEEAVGIAERLP